MSIDISANTFDPRKNFAGVVVGQGQLVLDSVINEQEQIVRHRIDTSVADIMGASATPSAAPGFGITVSPDGKDLLLTPGRTYVDGILCVDEPAPFAAVVVGASSVATPPLEAPPSVDSWLEVTNGAATSLCQVTTAGTTLELSKPLPGAPAAGTSVVLRPVTSLRRQPGRPGFDPFDPAQPEHVTQGAHRIELHVRLAEVSVIEEPSLRESALGDADQAGRLRVLWQLRLAVAGAVGGGSCVLPGLGAPGLLAASTVPAPPTDEPCVLPDESGYRGLDNQLYRFQVHTSTPTSLVLLWQRDNASTASRVIALGKELVVEDMGRDTERGFDSAAFVEITDDQLQAEGLPGDVIAVSDVDRDRRMLRLATAPAVASLERGALARRWDGQLQFDLTSPTVGDPRGVELGLQVALTPGRLAPGDHWLVPARTSATAGGRAILTPVDPSGAAVPQPPIDSTVHRAPLALVDSDGATFTVGSERECRIVAPTLTTIAASDVSFTPNVCDYGGATTVQQALDALCGRQAGGMCSITATPGPGWQRVFDLLAAGTDAEICFPAGEYPLSGTLVLRDIGRLRLRGVGSSSRIVVRDAATALQFIGGRALTVESLAIDALDEAAFGRNHAGALSATGVGEVTVVGCRLRCVDHARRAVSCLRIQQGNVRVERCVFEVGNMQIGLVLLDVSDAVVTENRIATHSTRFVGAPPPLTEQQKSHIRRLLYNRLAKVNADNANQVPVVIEGKQMRFRSNDIGRTTFPGVLRPSYPTMRAFQRHLDAVLRSAMAGRPVAGAELLAEFVRQRIRPRQISVHARSIVVAGAQLGDVRVQANTLVDALQGVHVGITAPLASPLRVGSVRINDNTIHLLVPPESTAERHGIYVGAAEKLWITGNEISCTTRIDGASERILQEGIRVFGSIGPYMIVRENVLGGLPGGIGLAPLPTAKSARLWAAENNLALGAGIAVRRAGPLKAEIQRRGNVLTPDV